MRSNTPIHQHQDRIAWLKRSMQEDFCQARIENATRIQRRLRLLLRQVEKRYSSFIDTAWRKHPTEKRHRRLPICTRAVNAWRDAHGIAQ